jgi:INO80 complex subunit C
VNTTAPPSLLPKKKYCDLTGYPTTYTDPKSRVNYYSATQYAYVQAMANDQIQRLLALRRANVRI